MTLIAGWRGALADLSPANFGLVMATGIVALAASMMGFAWIARALFALNVLQYAVLALLYVLRALLHPRRFFGDMADHAVGPGYFTVVAATGVLASQYLVQRHDQPVGMALGALTLVLWAAFTYSMFLGFIVKRHKPSLVRGISGSWLLAVVATQSVAVVCALLAPGVALHWRPALNFLALTLWLWAGVLYLWLMGLIFYRFMFLRLAPEELVPSYWINMGALAITTLAGSLLVLHAPAQPPLGALVPFIKGFTLFFWASATWWIPLLAILELWRHGLRHVRLRYAVDDWDIVFPLGMYTVGTNALAQALDLDLLQPVSDLGVYISLLAWLLVAAGALRHWRHAFVRS